MYSHMERKATPVLLNASGYVSERADSALHILELERYPEAAFFTVRHNALKVVDLLTAHAYHIVHDLRLYLHLGVLDGLNDLLRRFPVDA